MLLDKNLIIKKGELMKVRNSVILFVLVSIVISIFTGCSQTSQEATSVASPELKNSGDTARTEDAGILKVAVFSDAKTLMPFVGNGSTETFISGLVYDTLISYDEEKKEYSPLLAKEWSTSADGRTLSFVLNEKAKWPDGSPVTADDVVFSYDFVFKNKFPGQMAILQNFDHITKTGENSVDIVVKSPSGNALRFMATAIVILPSKVWADISNPKAYVNYTEDSGPVGSGPVYITKKVDGRYILLNTKKDYYNGPLNIDQIKLSVVRDTTVGVAELQKGTYDVLDLSVDPALASEIEKNPEEYKNIKVNVTDSTEIAALMFNVRKYPWNDINLRRAIALTVNQKELIDNLLEGYGSPASPGMVSQINDYFNKSLSPREQDLQAARQLLSDSGYIDIDNDGFVETPKGEKLTLELLCGNTSVPMSTADYLVLGIKSIGINAVSKPITHEAMVNKKKEGNSDVFVTSLNFGTAYDMLYYYFNSARGEMKDGSVVGFNYGGFCDPRYDELSDNLLKEKDVSVQKQYLQEMQQIIADSYYYVPLYSPKSLTLYRDDRFTGWTSIPGQSILNGSTLKNLKPKP